MSRGIKLVMVQEELPPRIHKRPPTYADQLEEAGALKLMRRAKGKWFRIADYKSPQSASNGKTTLTKQLPDFEWVTRGLSVYGRYVAK